MPRYTHREWFWEIELSGAAVTVGQGALGSSGQWACRTFKNHRKALREYQRQIERRLARGYTLVAGSDVSSRAIAALEAALLEDPDDLETALVYGDTLQARGDPRGELVGLQARRAEAPRDKTLALAEHNLLRTQSDYFLGSLAFYPQVVQLRWQLGFIRSARIGLGELDPTESDGVIRTCVETLLGHPSARFLQELILGVPGWRAPDWDRWEAVGPASYEALLKIMRGRQIPALRRLYIGASPSRWKLGGFDLRQGAWSPVGDLGALWQLYPRLEAVTVQGPEVELGRLSLPKLRRFSIRTNDLSRRCFESICAATWPRLERLSVWFGEASEITLGQLGALLAHAPAASPSLAHLGLVNAPFSDDLCALLVEAPVAPQLRSLDLSLGTLTDRGAGFLCRGAARLAGLRGLNVHRNYLTSAGASALLAAFPAAAVELGHHRRETANLRPAVDSAHSLNRALGDLG